MAAQADPNRNTLPARFRAKMNLARKCTVRCGSSLALHTHVLPPLAGHGFWTFLAPAPTPPILSNFLRRDPVFANLRANMACRAFPALSLAVLTLAGCFSSRSTLACAIAFHCGCHRGVDRRRGS